MNAGMQEQKGLDAIVTEFAQWVKHVADTFTQMSDESDVQRLEQQVREGGQRVLGKLMQQVTQTALDRQQEATRICPHCGARRRHQGVRPRQLKTSLGTIALRGIYWKCPGCGLCGHSAEGLSPEAFSRLLRGLVCLVGTALTSFDKAELVLHRVLGVAVDDETTRRHCQKEGWMLTREADEPPPLVAAGGDLTASGDGTMVHTRENGWREVKGYRFEHGGGCYGGAYLEKVERFAPRVKAAAERLGQNRAARRVFLSDLAEWITQMVPRQLPGWKHIADYFHACQHIHKAGEAIYGQHHPRARQWSGYWSRRLRRYGATGLSVIPLHHYTTSSNRKDRHHIFPRAMLAGLGLPSKAYNSICNICLLTADENQAIGMRRPRKYLGDLQAETTYFKSKLERHLIPYHADAGIWDRDIKRGFRRFMAERTDRICRELEKEAGIRLFRREK